jgi:hypothetical protein
VERYTWNSSWKYAERPEEESRTLLPHLAVTNLPVLAPLFSYGEAHGLENFSQLSMIEECIENGLTDIYPLAEHMSEFWRNLMAALIVMR